MVTATADRELIEAVVAEMEAGINCAVNHWMTQIEAVFEDNQITSLGRLHAIKEILKNYRLNSGFGHGTGQSHAA